MKNVIIAILCLLLSVSITEACETGWNDKLPLNITEELNNTPLIDYPYIIVFDCTDCNFDGSDIRLVFNDSEYMPFGLQRNNDTGFNISFRLSIGTGSYNDSLSVCYGNPSATATNVSWNSIRYNWYDDFDDGVLNTVYYPNNPSIGIWEGNQAGVNHYGMLFVNDSQTENNGVIINLSQNFSNVRMEVTAEISVCSYQGIALRTINYSELTPFRSNNSAGYMTSILSAESSDDCFSPAWDSIGYAYNGQIWQDINNGTNQTSYRLNTYDTGAETVWFRSWTFDSYAFNINATHSNFTTIIANSGSPVPTLTFSNIIADNNTGNHSVYLFGEMNGVSYEDTAFDNLSIRYFVSPEPSYTFGALEHNETLIPPLTMMAINAVDIGVIGLAIVIIYVLLFIFMTKLNIKSEMLEKGLWISITLIALLFALIIIGSL